MTKNSRMFAGVWSSEMATSGIPSTWFPLGQLVEQDLDKKMFFLQFGYFSTSYPSWNQVDGSPLVAIILNRSSIGWTGHPRTFMNFVIAFVFLMKFYIRSYWFALLTPKI